jgi:hypothetical protein
MDPALGAASLLGGKLAFGAAGIAAGSHVLGMARRDGGFGPHALAAVAIAAGSLGLLLFPLARALPGSVLPEVVSGAGEILLRVAFALLAVFVWRVFRPDSRAAGLAAAACGLLLLATFTWDLRVQPSLALYDATLPSAWAAQFSFALVFAWSCGEAALEWRRARRRAALGLADPLVAHRFGLWAVATGALVGVSLLGNAVGFAQSRGLTDLEGGLMLVRGLLYLPAVLAVWLGVFQPRWYRRTLGQRADG